MNTRVGVQYQYKVYKYNKKTRKSYQVARVVSVLFSYACDKIVAEQEALAKELELEL